MKPTSLPRPNEQRKVENLLVKLAKIKPPSTKPALIRGDNGDSALRSAVTFKLVT
jgi:hypothetical protein